jgi:hypothetical protein
MIKMYSEQGGIRQWVNHAISNQEIRLRTTEYTSKLEKQAIMSKIRKKSSSKQEIRFRKHQITIVTGRIYENRNGNKPRKPALLPVANVKGDKIRELRWAFTHHKAIPVKEWLSI